MADCVLQIAFWSLTSVLVTIVTMYLVYRWYISWYINSRVDDFYSRIDEAFVNFCNELTPVEYREEVYIPFRNGIYEKTLGVALLDIAFSVTKASCPAFIDLPNPPGFTSQLRVEGIDPNSGQTAMYAYIFWDKGLAQAVIAFTGTATPSELLSDFQFSQVPGDKLNNYRDNVLVHRGFYNIYLAVQSKLWDWWDENKSWVETLYITGHSLGGALSTICAYDFAEVFACNGTCNYPIHYSFAAPRSGNPEYARTFNEILPTSLRINNTCDIVPQLPPSSIEGYVYEETGGNIPFTVALATLKDDHILSYFYDLPECAEVAACYLEDSDRVCCDCYNN